MTNKEKLLQNLKALAEKGSENERENAKKILDKLLAKYEISEASLNEETISEYYIKYSSRYEKKLISQTFYSVCGDINSDKTLYIYKIYPKRVYFTCSSCEYLEILAKYNFYKYHFEQDFNVFYKAFLVKNNIYPNSSKVKEFSSDFTEEDKKARVMAFGMEKHEYVLQIENKGDASE